MPSIKELLGDSSPESGDRRPESGERRPETGERRPESGEQKSKWRTGYDGNVYVVKVRTEKRRGKLVTIAWNFQAHPKDLHDLLATCKKQFGTGGQVLDNSIEIQGDHVAKLKELLTKLQYKVV